MRMAEAKQGVRGKGLGLQTVAAPRFACAANICFAARQCSSALAAKDEQRRCIERPDVGRI